MRFRQEYLWPSGGRGVAELHDRIARTLAFVEGLPAAAFDGAETRSIEFPVAGKPCTMAGGAYLNGFALPNFYFHVTAVYMILRANGVALSKRDFLGNVPGLQLG